MRIRKVTPVSVAYPEPNDDNNTRYLTLCRIEADDGTVGWGESITQFPESTAATERLIAELLVAVTVVAADADNGYGVPIPAPEPVEWLARQLAEGIPQRRIHRGHRLHR